MTSAAPTPIAGTVKDAVRAYTARGFRCVPLYGVDELGGCLCGSSACRPRDAGKHEPPESADLWKDGRVFGPDDFHATDNVAIALGPWRAHSWLVCLDMDGTDDSRAFFPRLPATLSQRSQHGLHLFFTVPEFEPLGNWVDVFGTRAAGFQLDLRYARGRIVVAPSRGAHGAYQWQDWRAPVPLPSSALSAIYGQRQARGLPVSSRWERGSKAR
jgi:hypothetical protein